MSDKTNFITFSLIYLENIVDLGNNTFKVRIIIIDRSKLQANIYTGYKNL